VVVEHIDFSRPWDFFDGASQENGDRCGGGGVLFLTPSHFFNLKWGLGQGSNNFAEILALKLLLTFASEKEISNLQIFGDSMLVINWLWKSQQCHNIILSPILDEVFTIANIFTNLSFQHVYRERNVKADSLSKEGSFMAHGQ
jgi:ribonuclease HI